MKLPHIFIQTLSVILFGLLFTFSAQADEQTENDNRQAVYLQAIFEYSFGTNPGDIARRLPEPDNYIVLETSTQTADPTIQTIAGLLKTDTKSLNLNALQENISKQGTPIIQEWLNLNASTTLSPNLSVNALLGTRNYEAATADPNPWVTQSNDSAITAGSAEQFINYLIGGVTAFPQDEDFIDAIRNLNDIRSRDKPATIAKISNYIAERYSYAALASVAIDNLYYLREKRLPGDDGISQQEAEFLSVAKYDQDWRDELALMPQKQVLEQIAILLAEQQKQNYLRGQENERSLAAESISALLKLQETKFQIIYPINDEGLPTS